jgi:TolB-like protein/DNA-binding winged helix-turn-helix (wHTH) protein/Tfp pilus assembly protein PilF
MGESTHSPRMVRFGVYEVDLRAGELRKSGVKIKLQEQPFQILALLLGRPGEVVTREEIQKQLWPADTFVDFEHSLNAAVKRLREALGDSADNPRFVETLPRRGYRFIYPVEGRPSTALGIKGQAGLDGRRIGRRAWLAALGLLALVAVLVGLNVGGLRERLLGRAAPGQITSIAVLPLANLSGDPEQDYFVDGMTETLITELSKIRALTVISRQSVMQFKGTDKPLPEIARELNVDAVVQGSALHIGERVRITVQLIEAASDRNLWAENYDRELRDILALHSDVARAIASEIRIMLTPEEEARLARTRPVNPEAYEAYLKGRYFWNKRTEEGFKKAIGHFERAIASDPTYALAYSGVADSYILLGGADYGALPPHEAIPKARSAALKALGIDSTIAEAHASMGGIKEQFEWDWNGSEREYKRALELNPSYATAHHWYAFLLMQVGQLEEALAEMKRAKELDPLSLIINADLGWAFYLARQYDDAISQLRSTLELDSKFVRARFLLGRVYTAEGMYEKAIPEFQKAVDLSGNSPVYVAGLGYGYAAAGKKSKAIELLNELAERAKQEYVAPYDVALVYVGLDQVDQAFIWLEKAYEVHSDFKDELKLVPILDPLRDDPRFQDLLRRMNFPEN